MFVATLGHSGCLARGLAAAKPAVVAMRAMMAECMTIVVDFFDGRLVVRIAAVRVTK